MTIERHDVSIDTGARAQFNVDSITRSGSGITYEGRLDVSGLGFGEFGMPVTFTRTHEQVEATSLHLLEHAVAIACGEYATTAMIGESGRAVENAIEASVRRRVRHSIVGGVALGAGVTEMVHELTGADISPPRILAALALAGIGFTKAISGIRGYENNQYADKRNSTKATRTALAKHNKTIARAEMLRMMSRARFKAPGK
jgi:hypothetical protein